MSSGFKEEVACPGSSLGFSGHHCRPLLLHAQLLSMAPTYLMFRDHSRPSDEQWDSGQVTLLLRAFISLHVSGFDKDPTHVHPRGGRESALRQGRPLMLGLSCL